MPLLCLSIDALIRWAVFALDKYCGDGIIGRLLLGKANAKLGQNFAQNLEQISTSPIIRPIPPEPIAIQYTPIHAPTSRRQSMIGLNMIRIEGQMNATLPLFPFSIDGIEVPCLVDTGSEISIAPFSCVKNWKCKIEPVNITIKTPIRTPKATRIIAKTKVDLVHGEIRASQTTIYLVPDEEPDFSDFQLIIGLNTISDLGGGGLTLDPNNLVMTFGPPDGDLPTVIDPDVPQPQK